MAKNKKAEPPVRWSLNRVLPWLLLVAGFIGLAASIGLANEVFSRLQNPNFVPICNLNPVLSCTSVADSSQAEAFGIPNYFIGIGGYAALATVGAVMLAGAKLKRWFWLAVEAGLFFAMAFITWLQFETLYRIGALCLFCIIIWIVTWPMFWYVTLYSLREGCIKATKRWQAAVNFAQRRNVDILILWYVVIIVLVLKRFWYYWSTLI